MVVDTFGITKLFATKTSGREWFNTWGNGVPRTICRPGSDSYSFPVQSGFNQDPQDPEFIALLAGGNSDNSRLYCFIDGQGICRYQAEKYGLASIDFRPYIMDLPLNGGGINAWDIDNQGTARKTWTNVEMTTYVNIRSKNYDGALRLSARSNHFNIQNCRCDAKGYDFQIESGPTTTRAARCFKEVTHDAYGEGSTNPNNMNEMGHGNMRTFTHLKADRSYVAENRWVGMKLVVRTITSSGFVRLQGFIDLENGLNGGNWLPVIDFTDSGNGDGGIKSPTMMSKIEGYWAVTGHCGDEFAVDTSKYVEDPAPYNGNYDPIITRSGYSCYFRTDGVNAIDLKKFSIREIDPL